MALNLIDTPNTQAPVAQNTNAKKSDGFVNMRVSMHDAEGNERKVKVGTMYLSKKRQADALILQNLEGKSPEEQAVFLKTLMASLIVDFVPANREPVPMALNLG